jgi:hypothetical protein
MQKQWYQKSYLDYIREDEEKLAKEKKDSSKDVIELIESNYPDKFDN